MNIWILVFLIFTQWEYTRDTIDLVIPPGKIVTLNSDAHKTQLDSMLSLKIPAWIKDKLINKLEDLEMEEIPDSVMDFTINKERKLVYITPKGLYSEGKLVTPLRHPEYYRLGVSGDYLVKNTGEVIDLQGRKVAEILPEVTDFLINRGNYLFVKDKRLLKKQKIYFLDKKISSFQIENVVSIAGFNNGLLIFTQDGIYRSQKGHFIRILPLKIQAQKLRVILNHEGAIERIIYLAKGRLKSFSVNTIPLITLNTSNQFMKISPSHGFSLAFRNKDTLIALDNGLILSNLKDTLMQTDAYPIIKVYDVDSDGLMDILIGGKRGLIQIRYGNGRDTTINLQSGQYSSPTVFNGHIVTGALDGKIYGDPLLKNIDVGSSSVPACYDFNRDGIDDIVIGNQDGKVYLYLSPDYSDGIFLYDAGELARPVIHDVDADGLPDIVVTNVEGKAYFLKNYGNLRFVETASFMMETEEFKDLSNRYINQGMPVRIRTGKIYVDKLLELLKSCDSKIIDEVAFSIAYMPSEVLRAMIKMGNIDLLKLNAESIYRMADITPYAKIIEAENYTTIVYDSVDTLPYLDYYFYVVHPRILYEIPARIDVSFWDKPPSYYGMSEKEWLKYSKYQIYRKNGQFWRLYWENYDPLLNLIKKSRTLLETAKNIHQYFTWNRENAIMRFGYLTQDLQPLLIWAKKYGSCGEQSILLASIARTALIPIYVVTDRGEDHQWNEFWYQGTWHHWDLNMKKGIDNPSASAEGMKKNVSSVTGWRPDDHLFDVTSHGYTETGLLKITVLASNNIPADGALVVVRSHWNNRNSVAIWGYTNENGEISFNLGYEPLGYTVEVLSPLGIAGISNLFLNEHDTVEITLKLPLEFRQEIPTSFKPDSLKLVKGELFIKVPDFITGAPYRIINSYIRDTVKYRGTGIKKIKIANLSNTIFTMVHGKTAIFNPYILSWMRLSLEITRKYRRKPPKINVVFDTEKPYFQGDKIKFEIFAEDEAGIRAVYFSNDGGKRWQKIGSGNHMIFQWNTSSGGPIPPGPYKILFKVRDKSNLETISDTLKIELLPQNFFKDQLVYQDNPEDTIPDASWIYGPLFLKDTLRFVLITTNSTEKGLDLDLFLIRDKNGNLKVDSKKEIIAKSTSPTNREKIYVNFLPPGVYWIYAQGCTVEDHGPKKFDIKFSFKVNKNMEIVDYGY